MNELRRGSETDRPSSKATNSEIVKPLINMVQIFTDQQNPESQYTVTIDEDNLISRIGLIIRTFQRQQDRIGDMMDGMKKIVSRE